MLSEPGLDGVNFAANKSIWKKYLELSFLSLLCRIGTVEN
jgi:hypothetical protein